MLIRKFTPSDIRQIAKIKIHSSLFAVPFYQKLGYKKTTGVRDRFGLKIQPMKKILS